MSIKRIFHTVMQFCRQIYCRACTLFIIVLFMSYCSTNRPILFMMSLTVGGLSIAVPGEVSGLYAAWQMFGRVPWAELVQPTIDLCEEGFIVERDLSLAIRQYETAIRADPNLSYVYLLFFVQINHSVKNEFHNDALSSKKTAGPMSRN